MASEWVIFQLLITMANGRMTNEMALVISITRKVGIPTSETGKRIITKGWVYITSVNLENFVKVIMTKIE